MVSAQPTQAPERAAQRYNSGLTALRATELLISCREARWFQCSASRVVRAVVVVRRSLLSNCPCALTLGRVLALRDVLLG